MVIDSSAIVAIYLKEPGFERLLNAIDDAPVIVVGVPTILESAMVLSARIQQDPRPLLLAFLRNVGAQTVVFNEAHLDAAVTAFLRFGRGRHPAGLNFGDCMSYAIAAVARLPLLFTGHDFTKTDIQPALGGA